MKKIMLGLLFMLGLCNAFGQSDAITHADALASQTHLENHVAITKTTKRVVTKTEYVLEITLKDYSGSSSLPGGFGSGEKVYADDGRQYDLIGGDGIYTTKDKYPFKTAERTNLESNKVIFDPNFQHKTQVDTDPNLQAKVKITCKFVKVGCPPPNGGNCPACRMWGWSCWELQSCDIGVEFL